MRQRAYGLLNGRVGYRFENFEVYLFGRNLFEKQYVNDALHIHDPPTGPGLLLQPGFPATAGGEITADF